ncbi:hypothetical protein BDN71DRAFT_1447475 [Pleurotus eryngii]|uniref:Uncharacterized protein n=1 Tax=Pleurotus eryngii TaxID=5323 RepID=A0A9P5ZY05_PLEER|nr:hypothetical protein BDN71DRAFT_1447475 [Pleurotus eryngii]
MSPSHVGVLNILIWSRPRLDAGTAVARAQTHSQSFQCVEHLLQRLATDGLPIQPRRPPHPNHTMLHPASLHALKTFQELVKLLPSTEQAKVRKPATCRSLPSGELDKLITDL